MHKETTERLFDQDSYLKEFQATVLDCEKEEESWRVVLDRTAFFPEGGGQSGDCGVLGTIEVTGTIEKDGIIYHLVKEPLQVGQAVEGKIDFSTRFDKMQQHTGEHIVSGIVSSLYGYHNVGFHLGDEVTTFDFDGAPIMTSIAVLFIGNGMISRMLSSPAISITIRSTPGAIPACGGAP